MADTPEVACDYEGCLLREPHVHVDPMRHLYAEHARLMIENAALRERNEKLEAVIRLPGRLLWEAIHGARPENPNG